MNEIDWHDYIDGDPEILGGKPKIKGSRLSAEHILGLFASGWTWDDVLANYPGLTKDQVRAVFHFAMEVVQEELFVFPTSRSVG